MTVQSTRPSRYGSRTIVRRWSPFQVASLVTLFGCGGDVGPKPEVIWEGTVTSTATGAPISGAGVAVGDGSGFVIQVMASGTTDAQGHYTLSHRGCFQYPYLTANAPGYNANDKPVSCRAGTQTADISLEPTQ